MEIIEKDGIKAIKFNSAAIAVLPYTVDQNGVLREIGIVKEKNPHFPLGYSENIIMGTVENSDTSLLKRAMIELNEEGGLDVGEDKVERWSFLGDINTTKISPDPIYVFAVNVSSITPQAQTQDKDEELYSFSLKPVKDALEFGDTLLVSSFFKLFLQIYNKDLKL